MSEQKTSQKVPSSNTNNAAVSANATNTTTTSNTGDNYSLPSEFTLKQAVRLAIVEDKPIMMDYWTASIEKKALIGAKDNGEKLLVKSEDEYTSSIAKIYKSGSEYIVVTENSLYIVSNSIPTRKIS
jgi:hypothetical protein